MFTFTIIGVVYQGHCSTRRNSTPSEPNFLPCIKFELANVSSLYYEKYYTYTVQEFISFLKKGEEREKLTERIYDVLATKE